MAKFSVPISNLEKAVSSTGKSLTYAVLHSLFSTTEKTKNPIRDIFDCFLPFVRNACVKQVGKQIDLELLKIDLGRLFGLDIPIYTLEHMIPLLSEEDIVSYDNISKIYIVNNNIVSDESDVVISEKIKEISNALENFINKKNAREAIISDSSIDAFINFLKPSRDSDRKTATIKKAIISDPIEVERYLIAEFIRHAHENDESLYQAITHVFVGVLIEEFTSTISLSGANDDFSNLVVFYDTSLILRLLGTSGKLMKTASLELHRYLEDLKIQTEFFHNNEQEVQNILSAIIASKDGGYGIYGETGEAIIRGEITTTELRSLEYTFVDRLAHEGAFPSNYEVSGFQKNVRSQIDETAFSTQLMAAARSRNRSYSQENADHDAISIAHVVRMRRSNVIRDVAECPALFITSNRFLASFSRKFLIKEGHIRGFEVPPVMHVSQASTVFWLAKDGGISDRNASQELMANCYEAMRPDPNFYTELFKSVGEIHDVDGMNSSLTASVRRVARDDSFGKTAILRVLSAADLLAKAEEFVREKELNSEKDRLLAKQEGEKSGRIDGRAEVEIKHRKRCDTASNIVVIILEVSLAILFIFIFAFDTFTQFTEWSAFWIGSRFLAVLAASLPVLDYFSISIVRKTMNSLRNKISYSLYELLYS